MINYDKPTSLIYSYSGVIPSAAFKNLSVTPVPISPSITGAYIQLVKFTICLSVRSGFGAPTTFVMAVANNFANQNLGAAELNYWLTETGGVVWEINPIKPLDLYGNNYIYDKGYSPTSLLLTADSSDAAREIADASYTLLYTKYTI